MSQKLPQVKDAMSRDTYQFADGMLTAAQGIELAKKHNVSALIINKRNEFDEYGLVLLSDIAKHVIAKDRSPERINLYEIMAKPMLTVAPTMQIKYCVRLFERFHVHTTAVIEDNEIVGMVDYTKMMFTLTET